MLIRSGVVTAAQAETARQRMSRVGGTLSESLVATGAVEDDTLTEFYRTRLMVPQVDAHALRHVPPKIVAMVPADVAIEFRVIPVAKDRDGNLTIAMSEPSDTKAVDELVFFTGNYVVRNVASQQQIAWALQHYYKHTLGQEQPHDIGSIRPTVDGAAADNSVVADKREPYKRVRAMSGQVAVIRSPAPLATDVGPVVIVETAAALPFAKPSPIPALAHVAPVHVSSIPITSVAPLLAARRKPRIPDPPELAARAGEVTASTSSAERGLDDVPAVLIDMAALREITAPAVTPIAHPPATAPQPKDGYHHEPAVVVDFDALHAPVQARTTQVAALNSADTSASRKVRDTLVDEVDYVAAELAEAPSAPILLVRPPSGIVVEAASSTDSAPIELRPRRQLRATRLGIGVDVIAKAVVTLPESSPASPEIDNTSAGRADSVPSFIAADEGTMPMMFPVVRPAFPRAATPNILDEGWSSTTETEVSATPYSSNASEPTNAIPLATPTEITQPATVPVQFASQSGAPSSAPIKAGAVPSIWRGGASSSAARELESATSQTFTLLTQLDQSTTRDEIIALLVAHLASSHRDSMLFVVRGMELVLFAQRPSEMRTPPAFVTLDRPSVLQETYATKLGYRGPPNDNATIALLQQLLGRVPDDVLFIPLVIKDRTIAIWCGTERSGPCFDEQLALVARAASTSLARLVRSKSKH
jgi:hypothetical protein